MKKQGAKDYRTSVILSEDQHLQLQKLAVENDVSLAWIIRYALTFFLKQQGSNKRLTIGDINSIKEVK